MISEAILTLKDRTGSSQPAIAKFIDDKYKKELPQNFKTVLSVQLKKFVKSERLVKIKNSYKLAVKETQKKKGKNDAKKAVTPKENEAKKISEKGLKIKRLNQVKTPEKKKKKAVAGAKKMKRLSQVKTPEGLKKKKNLTPMKRKSASKN